MRRTLTRLLGGATVAAVAATAFTITPAVAATPLPVSYNFLGQATTTALTPTTPPPGANDFSCKPSAQHPNPVVLVHGTFANMSDNWQTASPILVNHGYCVFAFNYGGPSSTFPIQGIGDIAAGAGVLSAFVDKVRSATGAAKVDLVGHSQGGMMPRYYLKFLGGAAKVDKLVGLAPSNHGTTLNGIATLGSLFGVDAVLSTVCAACTEQEAGSAFLTKLNSGGDTVPGVTYTVIQGSHDEIVTPYTSAFLTGPNVTNITVDQQCSVDMADHVEIASDPTAMADMLNALDPAHPVTVPCVPVAAFTGPTGPVPTF